MINNVNLYETWIKYQKYIKIFALALVGLIIFIMVISRTSNKSYQGLEKELVAKAEKYINTNDIHVDEKLYLTNDKLNINYGDKKCDSASGVLIEKKDDKVQYTPYLICDDYTSEIIKDIINHQNSNFSLKGDNPLVIIESQGFEDPGYINNTGYEVVEQNDVVDDVPGLYYVSYELTKDGEVQDVIRRMVVVLALDDDDTTAITYSDGLKLKLNGEEWVSIEKGQFYEELGATAIDSRDGDITSKIKKYGTVDINTIGEYVLTYEVTNSTGKRLKLERIVSVEPPEVNLDITSSLSTTELTNKDVTITLKISGDGYYRTLLPNYNYNYSSTINYKVSTNGNYSFKVYDKYGDYREEIITVDNINKIPPNGSCTINYKNSKTVVTVNASDKDGIAGYSYSDGQTTSDYVSSNQYTFNKLINNVYVKIRDKAGNISNISCSAKLPQKDLEVHMFMMGDGDAIVIRSTSYVIVVDGGYADNRGTRFVKYLKGLGITKIDAYIATHFDGDHIGAARKIFANFNVVDSYVQSKLRPEGGNKNIDPLRNRSKIVKPDTVINFGDEMQIKVVGPIRISDGCKNKGGYCGNMDSINFILTYGKTKFFFTGDYVQSSAIIKRYGKKELSNIDFLKQPHHGLHDYISKELIDIMKPKYVFVPDGRDHMSAKMKSWLSGVGAKVYHTCAKDNQTMVATSNGNKITIHRNVKAADFKR